MKILVALDLSKSTEKIIGKVEEIARSINAKIWLLHVAEPDPDFIGWEAGPQSVRDIRAKTFRDEHRQIQKIADYLRMADLEATPLLLQGPTAEKILGEASNLNVDLIVLGSHGRGAMYQLLVGSVSERVIHESEIPILIIPTHNRV